MPRVGHGWRVAREWLLLYYGLARDRVVRKFGCLRIREFDSGKRPELRESLIISLGKEDRVVLEACCSCIATQHLCSEMMRNFLSMQPICVKPWKGLRPA